jgi:hypothetical protein
VKAGDDLNTTRPNNWPPPQIEPRRSKSPKGGNQAMLLVVVLVPLVALVVGLDWVSKRYEANSPPINIDAVQVVQQSSWDGSVPQVKNWLKHNLRDPDSLEFEFWSPLEKAGPHGYAVRCRYRAKNGFGGYSVEDKVFALDVNGNVLGCEEYAEFQQRKR